MKKKNILIALLLGIVIIILIVLIVLGIIGKKNKNEVAREEQQVINKIDLLNVLVVESEKKLDLGIEEDVHIPEILRNDNKSLKKINKLIYENFKTVAFDASKITSFTGGYEYKIIDNILVIYIEESLIGPTLKDSVRLYYNYFYDIEKNELMKVGTALKTLNIPIDDIYSEIDNKTTKDNFYDKLNDACGVSCQKFSLKENKSAYDKVVRVNRKNIYTEIVY